MSLIENSPVTTIAHHEEQAVSEFLGMLEQHRAECEARGMYVEAELALKRLADLRAHEEARREEAVRSRHLAEKIDVEEAHLLEIEAFNKQWTNKVHEHEDAVAAQQLAMQKRQAKELEQWQQQWQDRSFLRPKWSKELLNLRRIEATLAKCKEYTEAQKVKMKADVMEKWELEELKKDWRKKVAGKQAQVEKQHQAELEAFQLRADAGREKLKRSRIVELNKILRRYHNLKVELEKKQTVEKTKLVRLGDGARMRPTVTPQLHLNPTADALKPLNALVTSPRNAYSLSSLSDKPSPASARIHESLDTKAADPPAAPRIFVPPVLDDDSSPAHERMPFGATSSRTHREQLRVSPSRRTNGSVTARPRLDPRSSVVRHDRDKGVFGAVTGNDIKSPYARDPRPALNRRGKLHAASTVTRPKGSSMFPPVRGGGST